MFHENATLPAQEPMVATINESNARANLSLVDQPVEKDPSAEVDDDYRARINETPWWIAEKFYWVASQNGGKPYLSPLPEFLEYVEERAAKAVDYGTKLVLDSESDEKNLVKGIAAESQMILQSLAALDELERDAYINFLADRATRNAVYAAIAQFELRNWARRAGARGADPSEHPSYAAKEDRRDNNARKAAVYAAALFEIMPEKKLDYEAQARSIIYLQARLNSRELLEPTSQATAQSKAASDAAALVAEAF